MRYGLALVLACALFTTAAMARDLGWQRMPPEVSDALYAFRQTNAPLAEAMSVNVDGDRQGRDRQELDLPPGNFNPASHLNWIIADVNGDGQQDVFLAVSWSATQGTDAYSMGAVMIWESPIRWRLACETDVFVPRHAGSTLRILPGTGWRPFEFRGQGVRPARYTWHREAGQMVCKADERRGG